MLGFLYTIKYVFMYRSLAMRRASLILGRERIVDGTTAARQHFADLFEDAASGTPVVVVSGQRQVLMLDRATVLEVVERLEAAEETLALLANPDAITRLARSEEDVRAGKGIGIDEAARLLGLEER